MGTADHPASVLESLADVVSLGVLEGNCSQGFRFGGTLQAGESWTQDVPGGQDYAPLDEILELSNVPRQQ